MTGVPIGDGGPGDLAQIGIVAWQILTSHPRLALLLSPLALAGLAVQAVVSGTFLRFLESMS
jgi:hypothetical protein